MIPTVVDPAEAIQLGLWTLLRNDPELMALGITDVFDREPEPKPYPYVAIPDANATPDSDHGRHGRATVVNIHTWVRGWLRERNERLDNRIGARIIALVDHQIEALDAVVDGHTVYMVRHERTMTVPDPDREIRHRVDRLRIHTAQEGT